MIEEKSAEVGHDNHENATTENGDEQIDPDDKSDLISELSAKIPVLNQRKTVVMDDAIIREGDKHTQILQKSMKLIDFSKEIQVFAGPGEQEREKLDIKVQRQLGSGS